jgi:DNA adenine methylase
VGSFIFVRMKITSPLAWLGGKSRLATRIVEMFPDHQQYCEVFGGSGAVLLAKPPSKVEVFNDVDDSVVNLFRVLRDPRRARRLQKACEFTLYSRSEFELAKEPVDDPVEKARRFLVRMRMSWGGLGKRWSFSITASARGMSSVVSVWNSMVEGLPQVHQRLRRVEIERDDWRKALARYDGPEALLFCDPPYQPATRVGGHYHHELTREDHQDLVKRLLRLEGMVVLAGYDNPDYKPLESCGWLRRSHEVAAQSSEKRSKRVECVWLSPSVADSC